MMRLLKFFLPLFFAGLFCLGLSLAISSPPAIGQTAPNPPTPAPSPATPPATTKPEARQPVAADPQRALDILKDDRRRAELIATLEAMIAAQAVAPAAGTVQPEGKGTKPALAIPLEPDSLGANLLLGMTELVNRAGARLWDSALLTSGLPRLASWIWNMVADPGWRDLLADAAWRLALVFGGGLAARWLTQRLLRRPRDWLLAKLPAQTTPADLGLARAEEGETESPPAPPRTKALLRRLSIAAGHLLLTLLPVLAFLIAAHLVTATPVGGTLLMQLLMLAPLHGYALWQALICVSAALTAPTEPALRLLPAGTPMATDLQRSAIRLTGLVVMGDALARMGWLLGMTATAHVALERIILMAAHVGVAVVVIRQRAAMAAWLADVPIQSDGRPPLRARLAPVWHWLALAGLVLLWLMLLLEQVGGPIQAFGLFLASGAVLFLGRLATIMIGGMVDRLDTDAANHTTAPEAASAHSLHGWLRGMIRFAIGLLTLLALFQVWGLPALAWLFATALGRQILGGFGTIGVTLAAAVVVWESANIAINRHLARLKAEARVGKAARLRTLLPMLRTGLLIAILIIVGLTVLSQFGVNIAPLLAGAGVVGIALGLGSQRLVQDVITGLFLLLENIMQVGDVVTLGGLTGVVEELSVRSIRLRAEDGSVHVIPFSAVTTVTNMTRDFGQAVIETRVAITEDYERVVRLLGEVFEKMRAEPIWESDIIGDLDMQGLARLDDTAMVIKCRLRCGPFARWRVLREFQRRMQQCFATNGVALPSSAPTVVVR